MIKEKVFSEILAEVEFYSDNKGIYVYNKGYKYHITNFSKVKYLHNTQDEKGDIIRVIQINKTVFHLYPEHLISV